MKVREKLLEQFGAAISSVLGDSEDKDVKEYEITAEDVFAIARKVGFYMDLK